MVHALAVPVIGVHLVEGDTGLKDVNEGEALVVNRFFDQALEVFMVSYVSPGEQSCSRGQQLRPWDLTVLREPRRAGSFSPFLPCWSGCLALGKAIDLIVVNEELHTDVPPHGVHQVVIAFTVTVSIPPLFDDKQFMVGKLDPCRNGKGSSVKTVEGIAFQVMGKLSCLTNA